MSTNFEEKTIQALILSIAIGLAFIFSQTTLSEYFLQITALCIILYILLEAFSKKIKIIPQQKLIASFIIFTFVAYLIIFSTGSLFSPVFFLVYFLLFGVAFVFGPYMAIIVSVVSIVIFLATPKKELLIETLQILSIVLIAPLSFLFAKFYEKSKEEETKVAFLKKEEQLLTKEVIEQEKTVREWTSTNFKERLIKIWENLDKLARQKEINSFQRQKITEISNQLSGLLKSAQMLEKRISK